MNHQAVHPAREPVTIEDLKPLIGEHCKCTIQGLRRERVEGYLERGTRTDFEICNYDLECSLGFEAWEVRSFDPEARRIVLGVTISAPRPV